MRCGYEVPGMILFQPSHCSPCMSLEHRASNPVSEKNLTDIETSTIVKLLRPYVPMGTRRISSSSIPVYLQLHVNTSVFPHNEIG
jgi:hypothetical protein